MKKIFKLIIPIASVMILGSCAKESAGKMEQEKQVVGNNVVSCVIDNNEVTKAGGLTSRSVVADFSIESGIQGLVLEESVSSLDGAQMPATKGTPVYTENFADVYSAGFNAMKVVSENGEDMPAFYPATFTKKEGSDLWHHEYAEALPGKSLFYFMAPAAAPEYMSDPACEDGAITFSLDPDKYPVTATDQKDVLFATSEIEPGKAASVNFFHSFAQVKFKQGNTDGMLQITKVEISNLLASGTCTVTPEDGKKSSEVSVWSQSEKTYKTFSQEYDGTVTYDPEDEYFGSSFYKDKTAENNLNINGDEKATTTFMCVPQTFSTSEANHVIATITYVCNGETHSVSVDFSKSLNTKSWEPGKLYTYSFTITDLSVTVEDTVVGDTKKDLVITNTGNSDGYIRIAVVSNWVKDIDGETVLVKACDFTKEGTITAKEGYTHWKKGSDGYYYYEYCVKGGETTDQIIEYKAADAPVSGAYLEMCILAQIVADRSVWGENLPSGLSTEYKK